MAFTFLIIRRVGLVLFIALSTVMHSSQFLQQILFTSLSSLSSEQQLLPETTDVTTSQYLRHDRGAGAGAAAAAAAAQQQQQRSAATPKKSKYQFGLAVAHCDEDYISWVDGIDNIMLPDENGIPQKTTWDAVVYERCGATSSERYSQWQRNIGSEECTAYLRYIIDRYDEGLPDIVYFLQPDSLAYNSRAQHKHTAFNNLQDLVNASAPILLRKQEHPKEIFHSRQGTVSVDQIGFLSLGNATKDPSKLVNPEGPNNNPVEVLQLMKDRAPPYQQYDMLGVVPGGCFAVTRDRILSQPLDFYKDLMLASVANENERRMCWNLEATWHVVFGEPLIIPDESMLSYYVNS